MFAITTWGESHGPAIGVVIDGCPAGVALSQEDLLVALKQRSPGHLPYTSPRQETDQAEILSGVFEGQTTGTPICILIPNHDYNSSHYAPIQHLLRPGHANYTYRAKYGSFDPRGGGRASARETACRVAAGAVAEKLLLSEGIEVRSFLKQIGSIQASHVSDPLSSSPIYCPDPQASTQMLALLDQVSQRGDSVGGVVEFTISSLPPGLGDPMYEKLEANLAKAMLSLPASKGFEIGEGFASATQSGSIHNDLFTLKEDKIQTQTNHAGGVLGGISTGMPVVGRVAFKPASSIRLTQKTLTVDGQPAALTLPEGSRHDPCVAIRAVPVVKAMACLVMADALLLHRCARL